MQISPSVAKRFEEVERRNRIVPIQFRDIAQSALAGAQTAEAIQADRDKKAKALEFQKLLDSGLPAMQQIHQELADPSMPDPALFTDSRDAVVSWYKLADEKLTQKRGGEVISQGGTYDELGRGLVKAGALSPKDYYSNARPGRGSIQQAGLSDEVKQALEKGMDAIEAQEKEDGAVLPDAARQAILRANGIPAAMLANKAVEAIWKVGTGGESAETLRKTAEGEKDRKAGLALKADEIRDRREQRVIDEAQGFAKDTKDIAKTTTAIARIDEALKESGVEDGLNTDDYEKIPAFGTGAKLWRDWLNDPAAVKVRQAVNIFILNKRKENGGTAVTPQESAVIEKALGINTRATAQAFIESLRNFAAENAEQLQSFEAGISDKALERIEQRGGVTSRKNPAAKPKGKPKSADDYLKEAGL